MSEEPKKSNGDLAGKAVLAGGAGAGVAIVLALLQQPELVKELAALLYGWGPLAVIAVVGMVFANQRAVQMVSTLERNAAAQQQLAVAVERISQRDDARFEAMRLTLGVAARDIQEVKEMLQQKARGASA